MKVCVVGLWHLGCVTAACLADAGFKVTGLDLDKLVVENLNKANPPLHEPGLKELIERGLSSGNLHFSTNIESALKGQDIIWITYDTPVNEDDCADVEYVVRNIENLFSAVEPASLVLVSSQLPVGTTRRLEEEFKKLYPHKQVNFAFSPENLRLGKAIAAFNHPERIVVGYRLNNDRQKIGELFAPFSAPIEWMAVESAEMTKHALNAFLATSVVFINEIASLCEAVGANAKEVERGLKSDPRIGQKAYLSPGGAFAGGTLARDVVFLSGLGKENHLQTHLISALNPSNETHKQWARGHLKHFLGTLKDKNITIWGLAYKAGTDTLRRSSAVELCKWLKEQQANIQAYDPLIHNLPDELGKIIQLHPDGESAIKNADALVIGTDNSEFKLTAEEIFASRMNNALIIDANCVLTQISGNNPEIKHICVGRGGA